MARLAGATSRNGCRGSVAPALGTVVQSGQRTGFCPVTWSAGAVRRMVQDDTQSGNEPRGPRIASNETTFREGGRVVSDQPGVGPCLTPLGASVDTTLASGRVRDVHDRPHQGRGTGAGELRSSPSPGERALP